MTELFDTDIIIVGAGTAGLVLAEELSRDSTLRVHVFEAGQDCTGHHDTQNVVNYTINLGSDRDWQFDTVPQAGFNGRTAMQNSGKQLGGSSSINGGYYVAPSRAGVEAWAKLGNPSWSYESMRQACLETVQIHGPDEPVRQATGLDGQPADARGTGPVQVTADLEEHPLTMAYIRALKDLGYQTPATAFANNSACGQPVFLTHDSVSKIRSDANTAFGPQLKQRPNVKITFDAMVKRIILEGAVPRVRARGVEVAFSNGSSHTFLASKEVVLAAGAFNTPKLLELSGIGQPDLLQSQSIPVVIPNPQVGERLRNHIMAVLPCELSREIPAASPGIKAGVYMRSSDCPGLVEAVKNYTTKPGEDHEYDDKVKSIFLDPKEGSSYHFMSLSGGSNHAILGVIQAIPFSQGTTHIASSNVSDKPLINPCFLSHDLDYEVLSRHLMAAATLPSQPALKSWFKLDTNGLPPAAAAIAGDVEKAKAYLRQSAFTTYHATGTASMRSRESGGVLDETMRVYDTVNLRVVDGSAIPLLPHGNPMAAIYGMAKLAAKMIFREHRE